MTENKSTDWPIMSELTPNESETNNNAVYLCAKTSQNHTCIYKENDIIIIHFEKWKMRPSSIIINKNSTIAMWLTEL